MYREINVHSYLLYCLDSQLWHIQRQGPDFFKMLFCFALSLCETWVALPEYGYSSCKSSTNQSYQYYMGSFSVYLL